ncbi:MAG: hypothetical protein GY927_19380 [bacterium]|nr:hypothetical protein [bacterium]
MKGDFSRGYNPDTKRAKSYRRVLLQQGRALLDSDVAALVDNTDKLIRETVDLLGCDAGSSDLGYFITPGQLLTLFDPRLGVEFITTGDATAVRDYSHKYLDQLPGLLLSTTGGAGTVDVALRHSLSAPTVIRLWVSAENPASATVNGQAFAVPGSPDYNVVEVTTSGDVLSFSIDATEPYWVAMIETREETATAPVINAAAGTYEIDGLTSKTEGGIWPDVSFPLPENINSLFAGAANGDRFAAYLEIRERHFTAVDDQGILEEALGGEHDTTTRTEAVAQIKLAPYTALTVDEVRAVFDHGVQLPGGGLVVSTPPGVASADPCDLPTPGGYTGLENRLYRFEVHQASDLLTVIKWSRENGSELFPVLTLNTGSLTVSAHYEIRDGDLVEILSDAIELSDSTEAALDMGLVRPQLMVGDLVRLVEAGTIASGQQREFTFEDPRTQAAIPALDITRYATAGLKLRRWSNAFIRNGLGVEMFNIEDGIEVEVSGSFEPADWWQYEARVGDANANGPWIAAPHGPERLYAPLAVLQRQADNEAVLLQAWLDSRFPKLCNIHADNVDYDNSKTGLEADTVQEAIDELFELEPTIIKAGCGEIVVRPENDLQNVFDSIPDDGDAKVCLGAGRRIINQTVSIANKGDLIISGIGRGTLLSSDTPRMIFNFTDCDSVILRDFSLETVEGASTNGAILSFSNCAEVIVDGISIRSHARVDHGASAIRIEASRTGVVRRVHVRNNSIRTSQDEIGVLILDAQDARVEDNHIEDQTLPFDIVTRLGDTNDALAASIGNVLIDNVFVNPDEFDTNEFVGSPIVEVSADRWGRPRIYSGLNEWGRQPVLFSTHPGFDDRIWENIIEANPIETGPTTPPEWIIANIRRLKAGLAREMFGISTSATIPAQAETTARFTSLRNAIVESAPFTFGSQGIVVALRRGPKQGRRTSMNVNDLIGNEPKSFVTVTGNRVTGFRQGINVVASNREDDRSNNLFATDVVIKNNLLNLRVPLFARKRHGVFVGHALSISVRENRIEMIQPERRDWDVALPPTDGIRLWGRYGPLLHVRDNINLGVTTGVRVNAFNTGHGSFIGSSWNISDNAYSGSGNAENISI